MKAIKIKVKFIFGDWKEVSEEQARRFVNHVLNGAVAIPINERAEYINRNMLMGCTVSELMQGEQERRTPCDKS